MTEYREEDFIWMTPVTIAQNYREARKRAGLTQRELARRIGVKPRQVSRWENAKARPTTDNFKKLSAELKM